MGITETDYTPPLPPVFIVSLCVFAKRVYQKQRSMETIFHTMIERSASSRCTGDDAGFLYPDESDFEGFRIDLPDFQRFSDASRSKPLCVDFISANSAPIVEHLPLPVVRYGLHKQPPQLPSPQLNNSTSWHSHFPTSPTTSPLLSRM